MKINLVTTEDLQEFKRELIQELQSLIGTIQSQDKKWLRSEEVKKLLNISSGTLQNLRINGVITYTKLGGILYYNSVDIDKVLAGKRTKVD